MCSFQSLVAYAGFKPAKAKLLRVIGNRVFASRAETLSESHVVAEKTALGVDQLHRFIEAMFLDCTLHVRRA